MLAAYCKMFLGTNWARIALVAGPAKEQPQSGEGAIRGVLRQGNGFGRAASGQESRDRGNHYTQSNVRGRDPSRAESTRGGRWRNSEAEVRPVPRESSLRSRTRLAPRP